MDSRGHVVADCEEGPAGGPGADEVEEVVGVVDGGGVEEGGDGLGQGSHGRDDQSAGNSAVVAFRPRRRRRRLSASRAHRPRFTAPSPPPPPPFASSQTAKAATHKARSPSI